jgi:glycosyltransferase involved in cell wall biosynthesis
LHPHLKDAFADSLGKGHPDMRVVAIITVRNESVHIERCLRDFHADGIETLLVDNDSTDDTVERAKRFLGAGLLGIERLPWTGVYSVDVIMAREKAVVDTVSHDWIVHADADEWHTMPKQGVKLIEGIQAADAAGYNCINFLEFVFIPRPGESFEQPDYSQRMNSYYFFHPGYPRRMKAWRRDSGLSNVQSGGHVLRGPNLRMFPIDFHLRHYIALSEEQVWKKYGGRPFAPAEVARGWHYNRVGLSQEKLRLRDSPFLCDLPTPDSHALRTDLPTKKHFWEW